MGNWKKVMKYMGISLIVMTVFLFLLPADVDAAPRKHTVTFIYGDKISQQKVSDGGYAEIPKDTSIPGFTFLGWSDSAVDVEQDKIILGMYANNTPYAPLTNSFSAIKKVNENMSAPFLPEWSLESPETGIPGVTCIVRWYNSWDMKLFKTDVVAYGATLPNPSDPVVDGIEFVGWEGNWTNVTEDRAIKAWGNVIEEKQDDKSEEDQTKTTSATIPDDDIKIEEKENTQVTE